jgi:hypothetical protein
MKINNADSVKDSYRLAYDLSKSVAEFSKRQGSLLSSGRVPKYVKSELTWNWSSSLLLIPRISTTASDAGPYVFSSTIDIEEAPTVYKTFSDHSETKGYDQASGYRYTHL